MEIEDDRLAESQIVEIKTDPQDKRAEESNDPFLLSSRL